MPWTERQRLMLREMGLRVWQPPHAAVPAPPPVNNDTDTARIGAQRLAPPPLGAPAPVPGRRPARDAEAGQDSTLTAAPLHTAQGSAGTEALASAGSVATLDWPALREAVSACRACRLCESRKQTVFGVGHPQAHWMIVGEAPGQQEDEQGEPFVGAAGQLLDAMLHALGLSRQAEGDAAARVFIANTLKCRPPGNRNPQPEEMQRCEPFLVRQIELVRPRLILAMGRFAVQALLRTSEPIGRLRGRAHRYQGVPLVVTYHPAYLLRNLPDKARAWEDLCLAAELMRTDAAP